MKKASTVELLTGGKQSAELLLEGHHFEEHHQGAVGLNLIGYPGARFKSKLGENRGCPESVLEFVI